MRTLSGDYLAAARAAGRYPNIRAVISGATITGNDAIIECHIMKGDSAKPAFFETALALSSECRMTIDRRRLNEALIVSGAKMVVYSSFDDPTGATIASEKLGTFYITSYDKSDAVNGIITASDFMLYTGVDFNPEGLTYPASISDIFSEAWRQSGKSNVDVDFDINPNVYSAIYKSDTPKAKGMQGNPYLCRDVLARIAAMNLGALYLDADEEPQIYKYQQANVADANILDIRVGSETYYVAQVLVFKAEERMVKKKSGYRQLPYAPRFEDMDFIDEGTPWVDWIATASSKIRNKPWTTATVTIQGVGEIELGDFVTAAGTTLLVTGISYDFANAHFTETLYSYAFTEEEYYMAPQKSVNVSTGAEKKGGVGENVGNHNERFNGYTAEDGCTITGASEHDYNLAESYKNVLNGCKYTHVGGKENSVTGGDCSFVTGENNIAAPTSGSDFSWSILSGNNIRAYGVNRSILSGSGHIINNLAASIVTGIEHTIVNNNVLGGIILGAGANTAARPPRGNAYTIVVGGTSALGNVFVVSDEGDVYCRTVTQTNADYAELFEWADGNPNNEDRRGLLVSLDGDKITLAHGDDIFGIVSANPAVICNSPQIWQGKFKRDIFGCIIKDENGEPILNPDYDPEKKYIPREQRPEWAAVGLVGRLIVRDNGSCKAGEWVVGNNGYAFPSLVGKTNVRCLKRIDDTHVEVLIR